MLIIGATNRPDSLDPALRRAGRFEKEICLTVPDEEAREKILRVMCQKLRLSGDFDFRNLAKKTPGFVGADLSALTAEAGRAAINRIFKTLKDPVPTPAPAEITNGEVIGEVDGDMDGGVTVGVLDGAMNGDMNGDMDMDMDMDPVDRSADAPSIDQIPEESTTTTTLTVVDVSYPSHGGRRARKRARKGNTARKLNMTINDSQWHCIWSKSHGYWRYCDAIYGAIYGAHCSAASNIHKLGC